MDAQHVEPNARPEARPTGGPARGSRRETVRRAGTGLALVGLVAYAAAAPHSIAGAWAGLSLVVLGWLVHLAAGGPSGITGTRLDLPLWLLFNWTILSAIFSYEPRISFAKLATVSTFLVFYLTQAALTRRLAVLLAALLILSASAGALWGAGEIIAGRGVLIEEFKGGSALRGATPLSEGDAVWRVGGRRVNSVAEIDEAIKSAPEGSLLSLSVITRGEHVEWPHLVVTEEMRRAASPSGIVSRGATHRFRASGWTRHYETFAEMLQLTGQLALGFALAAYQRRRPRRRVLLPVVAFLVLGVGIALTAMRTVLVAFAVGAVVILLRAAVGRRARAAILLCVAAALTLGALFVWRTRSEGALALGDDSANLRLEVARVTVERIKLHPVLGHGMDAVHKHWHEWGFPGDDMLHAHSTPLQIAFDRGLPALLLWLWAMGALWLMAARAERMWRDTRDAGPHGLLLGATGALAGFLASSLVNYNFGDSEAALLVWWLAGAVVVFSKDRGPAGDEP